MSGYISSLKCSESESDEYIAWEMSRYFVLMIKIIENQTVDFAYY